MTVLVLGALLGVGVYLLIRAVLPSRTPLAVAVARATASEETHHTHTCLRSVASIGVELPGVRRDLAVMERAADVHAATKVTYGIGAGVWVAACGMLLSAVGVSLPGGTLALASLAGLALGFFLPDLALREKASKRREEMRHALGAFLDVAAIGFASGSGPETALFNASRSGEGWAHGRLRHAVAGAQNAADPPWGGLDRLGGELGVAELETLAASVTLASGEGAQVRESIIAMSATLRSHLLMEAEEQAVASTERMSLPVALLTLSFIAFLTYPAVMVIVTAS